MNILGRAVRAGVGMLAKATGVAGTSTVYFGEGWFQKGFVTAGQRESLITYSAVYACVQTLTQDISKLPLKVYKKRPGGGRDEVTTGPLVSVIGNPNHYQTWVQFMTQVVTSLLYRGNSYIYVDRNGRNDPTDMYPLAPDRVVPMVDPQGNAYYAVGADPMRPQLVQTIIPARNIVHIRFHTLIHPLVGVSPITAYGYAASAGLNMVKQSANFFQRMARPSGVLKTPNTLKQSVIDRLRSQWEEYYGGENTGRVALLESGLEWQSMTMSAVDADLIAQLKWTVQDIARVFRVPTFMLGDLDKATFNNVETLMRVYLNSSLSYYLRMFEDAFNNYFSLSDQGMEVEFDTTALLRMEFNLRIEALAKAIQGGVYTPDEARALEKLPPMPGGDQLFMQYQMTPIDKLGTLQPGAGTGTSAAAPKPKALELKMQHDADELSEMISRNLRAKLPARL